jgi:hypothetical protein
VSKVIAGSKNAPSPFSVKTTVKVTKDLGGVWSAVWNVSDLFCKIYAELVRDIMIRNVSPGVGPGPHPHRTKHEDTGWAAKSIVARRRQKGATSGVSPAWFSGSFSDRTPGRTPGARGRSTPPWQYLFFLEWGFRTKSGKRYRYPWAAPAYKEAKAHRLGKVAGPKGLFISPGGKR